MPVASFDTMPAAARVWVFGAAAPITGAARDTLLSVVDDHLAQWKAHGTPLVCAREWRDDRFLAIAVDEAATGASGCSIDGLFRTLSRLEQQLGTSIVDEGRVFWRGADGALRSGTRAEFKTAAAADQVQAETHVFDTTINTVDGWRNQFEREARECWHARLVGL